MRKINYILFSIIVFFVITTVNAASFDLCNTEALVTIRFIGYGIYIIKIIVPLLIIVLGTIDLFRAVIASNDSAIKESSSKLLKRFIAGILIFFVTDILFFIFGLFELSDSGVDGNGDLNNNSNFYNCSTCLLKPTSSECENFGPIKNRTGT